MKRYGAHFIYCSPQRILEKAVVEINYNGQLVQFFLLKDFPEEIHSTIFFNGIIIPDIILETDITSFNSSPIIKTLDSFFLPEKELKEGAPAKIYLLEQLDLVNNKFTDKVTIRELV